MGRSKTPKYVVVMEGTGVNSTPIAWHVGVTEGNVPGYGKPTDANLAKYIAKYVESLKPGGANQHLMQAYGTKVIPNSARIVTNDGARTVVATWKAPKFMLI